MIEERKTGNCVIVTPIGKLLLGGLAEEYEGRIQILLLSGATHVIADLQQVPYIDSCGLRVVVRTYTTSRKQGVSFCLAALRPAVSTLMHITHLDTVIRIYPTVEDAVAAFTKKSA